MTSGTPSPADSPSLAQRPLLSSAAIVTTESSVVSTLTPSCEPEHVCVPAVRHATPARARHATPATARRTETVRFEITEDVADVSTLDRPNRDFPER
jgi:hypothetical protein